MRHIALANLTPHERETLKNIDIRRGSGNFVYRAADELVVFAGYSVSAGRDHDKETEHHVFGTYHIRIPFAVPLSTMLSDKYAETTKILRDFVDELPDLYGAPVGEFVTKDLERAILVVDVRPTTEQSGHVNSLEGKVLYLVRPVNEEPEFEL